MVLEHERTFQFSGRAIWRRKTRKLMGVRGARIAAIGDVEHQAGPISLPGAFEPLTLSIAVIKSGAKTRTGSCGYRWRQWSRLACPEI